MRSKSLLATAVLFFGLAMGLSATFGAPASAAEDAVVIDLTQTPCQFIEVEAGGDLGYKSRKKSDCEAINAESGGHRLAEARVLKLAAGTYVFRVTNKNVPYSLGFWLREKGYDEANVIKRLAMTSVSGGGLKIGTTKDYEVDLEPGEYIYSCPLNPTPNYRIIVEG
jgi:hypothetical protein